MRLFSPTPELTSLSRRLSEISLRQQWSPHEAIVFPETLGPDGLYLSPELCSLAGDAAWTQADDAQKRRLSFFEAANFFSINIHGEKSLLQGLAQRLYEPKDSVLSEYLHHFLEEENKHMVLFGTFCTRYLGKVYPERKISFPREHAEGEEDFLFFARVMIFEELVDVYNRKMAVDERLHPLARAINDQHHRDEVRHLAFGRQVVRELWKSHSPNWSEQTVKQVREGLKAFLTMTWREYYNPDVYADAGFADCWDLAERAWGSPTQVAHRQAVSRPCLRQLLEAGILLEEMSP